MLLLISPAKSFDFESVSNIVDSSLPLFPEEASKLIKKMKTFSHKALRELMGISADLAFLNFDRYQKWIPDHAKGISKQALLAYSGEVYRGLNTKEMNEDDLNFAQNHLRILSGLYGVLRPLDLIQAHRLEMGTKLKYYSSNNLYQFWGDKITKRINEDLSNSDYLINLASQEYFKSINKKKLKTKVITPIFKDFSNGDYKILMTYAKNARGQMANYIIKNQITDPELLKTFEGSGYIFDSSSSDEYNWVFLRG
jgi:cytoplasmic iron level regulating protein YaaA (DUF328/UPF0246 family)